MTRRRVPGWWQTSQLFGVHVPPVALPQKTCLSYDVDRRLKTPRPGLLSVASSWTIYLLYYFHIHCLIVARWSLEADDGSDCLLKAIRGNTEFTVLSNLPVPDYTQCAEPFVPFGVVPRSGINQQLKNVVEQSQNSAPGQVSTSAPGDAVGNRGKGSRIAIRKQRRRVCLRASFGGSKSVWEGIIAAEKDRRRRSDLVAPPSPLLGPANLGNSSPIEDKEDNPSRRHPIFAEDDGADLCRSGLPEELHQVALQEEFHRRFHEELSRSLHHERHGHNDRSSVGPGSKLRKKLCLPHWHCSNAIRVTSDRMNLGFESESSSNVFTLGPEGFSFGGEPLESVKDSNPAVRDTFALVYDRLCNGDDTDSSFSFDDLDLPDPSWVRTGPISRGNVEIPAEREKRRRRADDSACHDKAEDILPAVKKSGKVSTLFQKRHPFLKPMVPKAKVKQRPNKQQERQRVVAGADKTSQYRELSISPWDTPSPREDISNNNSCEQQQHSGFCFSIPLPGERSLQVRADTDPYEVHLSVHVQDHGPEANQLKDHSDGGEHIAFSTVLKGGASSKKENSAVSWSSPEVVGPGVATSLRLSSPIQRDIVVKGPAKMQASAAHVAGSGHGGLRSELPPVPFQGRDDRLCSSTLQEIPVQDNGIHSVAVGTGREPFRRQSLGSFENKSKQDTDASKLMNEREPCYPGQCQFPGGPNPAPSNVQTTTVEKRSLPDVKGVKVERRTEAKASNEYCGLREMIDWQRAISEYNQFKCSMISPQEGEKNKRGGNQFTKSSQSFLERLSKKSGYSETLCARALKPYSIQEDLEEKENHCEERGQQKCIRLRRGDFGNVKSECQSGRMSFPIVRPAKNCSEDKSSNKTRSEAILRTKPTSDEISVVLRRRPTARNWLSLFRKAIWEKSQQIKCDADKTSQQLDAWTFLDKSPPDPFKR